MAEQTRDPGCLQERCRALSTVYRLGYQHHRDSRSSGGGYPDVHLWAVPLRGSVWMELKRMGQDPAAAQVAVLADLQDAGHLVYLARPCCLLTGTIDEIMAELAGTPCLHVGGRATGLAASEPAATAREASFIARVSARHHDVAAGIVAARVPRPARVLPGTDPVLFEAAAGYLVPMPAGDVAHRSVIALEEWLRAAGFPAADVPFPIRVIAGVDHVSVQVRAKPGGERVWRGGVPARPFPEHLVDALAARVYYGPDSQRVAEVLTATLT